MHQQKEIVELVGKIAKKYGLTYYQVENAIYARFEIARENMKKSELFVDKKYVNVRLYKFCMFYISKFTRRTIEKNYAKHLENKEKNNNNLI